MPKGKRCWEFRNAAETSADLMIYGDISESSWWGDEVTAKEFNKELAALGAVDEITVHINSAGGDVFAAVAIGTALKQHIAHVTAIIEGCCCSAATIITCCCDTVKAAAGTVFMVHPVKMGLCNYYDAPTLQTYIDALGAIRDGILDIYAKKTGKDKDECAGWMDATSWWTPAEAKENGFVDELLEGEDAPIEDRAGAVFVNSVDAHMSLQEAPEFVRNRVQRVVNNTPAGKPENHKEVQSMDQKEIKTVDELRAAYPALCDQLTKAAAEEATNAERKRIQDIEEMALEGCEEMAVKAKYAEPVSASDYAVAQAKFVKTQGSAYLAGRAKDAKDSGMSGVKPGKSTDKGGDDEFLNAIRALGKKD